MNATTNARSLDLLNLSITPAADGKSVMLEQDSGGNLNSITLHASQVRAVVDQLELNWPETDRLKRALLRANGLASRLHKNLVLMDGMGHEDLTMEVQQALALADFLSFECQAFADDYEEIPGTAMEPATSAAPAPRSATKVNTRTAFDQGRASAGELFTQGAQT